MKLYLAQHGDSLPEEINSERPLSERGREDVQRVAQFVGAYGMRVKRVYHSGKLRARQTAELFATEVASEEAVEAVAGINPNDAVDPMADRINSWTDDMLLVGHLPFLGRLIGRLVSGSSDQQVAAFTPGSIICLERNTQGRWTVAWMLRPELLARM